MVDVVCINNLEELCLVVTEPERHYLFDRFWKEAGVIGRLKYVQSNPTSKLAQKAVEDAKFLLSKLQNLNPNKDVFLCKIKVELEQALLAQW